MSDIKLCQEEGVGCIRRSKKGQNCFDGPLLDVTYTIDPTSKMRIGISALGIVYKDFGGRKRNSKEVRLEAMVN